MRARPLPLVLLLALFVATGVVYRDSGGTAGPATLDAQQSLAAPPLPLPNREGSLKFGVLGDFGTGSREQYQLAEQMAKLHARFTYELVTLVGEEVRDSLQAAAGCRGEV